MKQLQEDPWLSEIANFKKGDKVEAAPLRVLRHLALLSKSHQLLKL